MCPNATILSQIFYKDKTITSKLSITAPSWSCDKPLPIQAFVRSVLPSCHSVCSAGHLSQTRHCHASHPARSHLAAAASSPCHRGSAKDPSGCRGNGGTASKRAARGSCVPADSIANDALGLVRLKRSTSIHRRIKICSI